MPTSYKIHEASYPMETWDEHIRRHETVAKDWAATMGIPWKSIERQFSLSHSGEILPYMSIRWVYYYA